MKSILLILVLILTSYSYAEVQKGSETISVDYDYAVMDATVACIIKYDNESEGDSEFPEIYFLNDDEYNQQKELENDGYRLLKRLTNGMKCSSKGAMKKIAVGAYDKKEVILKIINANKNAIVKAKVIFAKNKEFDENVKSNKQAVIDSLIQD